MTRADFAAFPSIIRIDMLALHSLPPADDSNRFFGALFEVALLVFVPWLGAFLFWRARRKKARRRLQEIDRGERCVSCNRNLMTIYEGVVRCNVCGHKVRLAELAATQISADDIAQITRTPDR